MARLRQGDRGAAAVEFALVLPLLGLFVLGGIDWGYFFYIDQVVNTAAREGARAGALADEGNRVSAATAAAQAYLMRVQSAAEVSAALVPPIPSEITLGGVRVFEVKLQYRVGSVTGVLPTFAIPRFAVAVSSMRIE